MNQENLEFTLHQIAFLENEERIKTGVKGVHATGEEFREVHHPYAEDLDILGSFSLYSLLNRATTAKGKSVLANFLLDDHVEVPILRKRQEAVKELSKHPEWVLEYLSAVYPLHKGQRLPERVPRFEPGSLEPFFKLYLYALPFLWAGVAYVFYLLGPTYWPIFLGIPAINFFLVKMYKEETNQVFNATEGAFLSILPLYRASRLLSQKEFSAEMLQLPPIPLDQSLLHFGKLIKRMELLKQGLASFFRRLFSPYDVAIAIQINTFNKENPDYFEKLLDLIGCFEAFCSLAHYSYGRNFPEISENSGLLLEDAKHPLLQKDAVGNNFELNQSNRISLITGSNMSGKSTFLRSVGCSLLLAKAGAAVDAARMVFDPRLRLFSYMRVQDDLSQSTSTFKYEIDRIKALVELGNTSSTYILLIDEMLRGTNSEDKLKGSMALLKTLVHGKNYALVATHDLRTTAISQLYPDSVKNFYFEFFTETDELVFDYKIKEGICTSFNASQLLRKAGLIIED